MSDVSQYHIKPQVALAVEAIQWDGTPECALEILQWFDKNHAPNESILYSSHSDFFYIEIKSGSFSMTATKGDYIVRSSKTRSSPKKFSIYRKEAFEAGYYKAGTIPTPTSEQAIDALRLKLTGE